jgi:hypothetical protein
MPSRRDDLVLANIEARDPNTAKPARTSRATVTKIRFSFILSSPPSTMIPSLPFSSCRMVAENPMLLISEK